MNNINTKYSTLYKTTVSIIVAAVIITGYLGLLDSAGESYTDEAFKRALVTFGIARGINGVISVAQGTEVALHPAGFGVNFTPGQILDPINDIIEQFSWVMLASSASLGIQKILLGISSSITISILLSIVLVMFLLTQWRPDLINPTIKKIIISISVIFLFVRFSVPVTAIASEALYDFYLKDQYNESTQSLEKAQSAISKLSNEDSEKIGSVSEEGFIGKARKFFETTSKSLSVNERFNQYKDSAALATEHAINLIVVFLIQTVFFPLLFLWVIYKGLKLLWNSSLLG